MAPNVVDEVMAESPMQEPPEEEEKWSAMQHVQWHKVTFFVILHIGIFYGFYVAVTSAFMVTNLFCLIYATLGGIGVTGGSHRLWSHRSYKARWPLRLFLCLCHSAAGQDSIFLWARNHRVHHKYSETNADPYSIKRGFFFAHMGWLMCNKHPEAIRKGRAQCLDDLMADPIVRFQHRYNYPLFFVMCLMVPTIIPPLFWGETYWNAFFCNLVRYSYLLHFTFCVNSVAHMFGNRPYDKRLGARENPLLSIVAIGEGWHNYHHAFPYDYAASELGYTMNLTKRFIDLMAFLGLAYDLKHSSKDMVLHRKIKQGDGTRRKVLDDGSEQTDGVSEWHFSDSFVTEEPPIMK